MLLIAITALSVLSACIPEAEAVGTGVVVVNATELFATYNQDQAAADSLYKGRTLEVTGEVQISKPVILTDQFVIVLYGSSIPTEQGWGIQCNFENMADPVLAEVDRHEIATIRGRCDGLQQDVVLRDCELLKAEPKPQ